MSILLSDEEFTDLRGRVVELETLLNRVEAKKGIASTPPLTFPEPSNDSIRTPVASPPLIAPAPERPGAFSVPAAPTRDVVPSLQKVAEPEPEVAALSTPKPLSSQAAVKPTAVPRDNAPVQEEVVPLIEKLKETSSHAPTPMAMSLPAAFSEPSFKDQGPKKSLFDWETLIGGKLALWLGALCLFLALASLLVYVGQTLPPPTIKMRVASGFVASFTLLACALAARIRGQRWFVDGLLGTGLGVGFLTVWGGGPHFGLWSPTLSVIGFGLYAGSGIVLSARRNSPALLILSAIGGYLTPLFIHYHNAHGVAFAFSSYLLVLNAGVVSVSLMKQWREIVYGAFGATVLLCFGWALDGNIEKVRLLLWVSASLGWILFAGAACFRTWVRKEEMDFQDAPLLICATGIYAMTSQWLLGPLMHSFPGAFSLGLTLVLGTLWLQTSARRPQDELLNTCILALACVSGVLAIPLQFGQSGLVWGWMAQSAALCFMARKSNSQWLRNSSRALWVLALLSLAFDWMSGAMHTGAAFDSFSLRLLFCMAVTAFSLLGDEERDWISAYGLVLSCGGTYWLGRTIWLGTHHFMAATPAYEGETALLVGSSAIALWSLAVWQFGQRHRDVGMRAIAALLLLGSLCTILGVGLWGVAPLHGLRVVSFAVGALALVLLGLWHARHNSGEEEWTREVVATGAASWVVLGLTLEVASWWNAGHFGFSAVGSTAWFALCTLWSLLAVGAGALSLWKTWPKLWVMAETLFAASVGVLLLNSLMLPHAVTPVGNARLGAFLIAWLVALLARHLDAGQESRRDLWLLAVLLLPLWASTQELWNGVETYHAYFGKEWQRFASLGISLWWSFYAMSCLFVGVTRRAQNLRIGALALGALAICKVFLLDLAFLDGGLRVLSLGGLGAALMFISWLYSRLGRSEEGTVA